MFKRMLLALVTVVGLFAQDAPAGEPQLPRLAVMPLKGVFSGQMVDQGDTVYQMVATLFHKMRRFDLIERAQLQNVLGEGKFQASGLVDDASAVELGKQLGAKFVLLGSWNGNQATQRGSYTDPKTGITSQTTSYTGNLNINLRMVDVQTGKIKNTFQATGASGALTMSVADALNSIMKDVNTKLERVISNEFPLQGIILKVLNDKESMIDVGKGDGVGKGDVFLAITRGEPIVHPRTGALIPGEKTILAELEVTRVDERTSIVKVSKNIAKVAFKVGMELEQKPKEAGTLEKLGDFFRR
jgi:hypothetical protein